MADAATTGGSITQSEEPGSDGAPPVGAPQAPGSPAPTSQGTTDVRQQLDATFRKGYTGGREKGRREAETEILALLGVDSVDALREQIGKKQHDEAKASVEQRVAEDAAAASTIRKLQAERAELAKRVAAMEAESKRFQLQSEAALRADLRARLLQMKAHEGVDDLVQTIAPRLRWAADGQSIEVVETETDGTVRPARESYAEWLEGIRTSKPWFFAAPQRTGSGSAPDVALSNPGAPPAKSPENFRDRLAAYRQRHG